MAGDPRLLLVGGHHQVTLPEQGGGSGGHHQLLKLVDAVEVVVGGGPQVAVPGGVFIQATGAVGCVVDDSAGVGALGDGHQGRHHGVGAGRRLEGAGDAALLQLLPHEPVRVLEGGVGGGVVLLEAPGEAVLEQVQEQGLGAGQEAWRRCWGWNWDSL